MLKFIKSLFKKLFKKKKKERIPSVLDLYQSPIIPVGLNQDHFINEFLTEPPKLDKLKSPVRSGYVELNNTNTVSFSSNKNSSITITKSEDNSFMVFNLGDYPTSSSSPCKNHDSYSYDQDNSSNDSSSSSDSSSSDFGGGDFGGGGAGGDW